MKRWQLQQAKNRLSEVVRMAADEPQVITLRGADAVVVVAASEYTKLVGTSSETLVQFLRSSPLAGVDLDLDRSRDTGRKVAL